jgi:transketolase
MDGFHKHSPQAYLELGIQEHHAAGTAGAMSCEKFVTFFSTFGSFAVSEVYNQNRLNDFNHSNVKVVATHVGLDVGEDGPTHQCIDYLGLMKNYFRFSVFMPADPNQTDRIIRHIATHAGNHFVGMGRSKTPTITREDGSVFFDADYVFTPGKADWLRKGTDAADYHLRRGHARLHGGVGDIESGWQISWRAEHGFAAALGQRRSAGGSQDRRSGHG